MMSHVAISTIFAAVIFFSLLNKFLEYGVVPIPKRYQGESDQRKWRSAAVSLVHSVITSVMASVRLVHIPISFYIFQVAKQVNQYILA